jgi:hypothetical protein
MEAHPGALEAHPGALEAHPGAVEAHPGALEARLGVVGAPPGAVKGPFFRHYKGKFHVALIVFYGDIFLSPRAIKRKMKRKEKKWIQGKKKQKESVLVLKNKAKQLYYFLVPFTLV